MSEKRRGLGRGLGALIPTSPEGRRPVDVFFAAPATPETDRDTSPVTSTADERTEGGSREGRPADGGPAEDRSSDDGSAEDRSAEDGPAEDRSSDDGSAEDRSAEDRSAEDRSAEDRSSDDGSVFVDGTSDDPASVGGFTALTVDALAELAQDGDSPVQVGGPTGSQMSGDVSAGADVDPMSKASDTGSALADGEGLVPVPGATFAELPVDSIRPNPRQPRSVFDEGELDELVGSIREIGVLQPIVVRPVVGEAGHYELIMGERRWRATQAAELATIPAIIRETDDSDLLRDALLENLHRSALNPLEEAAAYRQLLDDFGCTHEELAERISRSRPQISNTLRLLRLPPLVQRRVAAGVLSAGHARALLGLSDGGEIERLAQRIVAEGLSVRATEEIVALGSSTKEKPVRRPRAGQRSAAIDELATRLSDRFETRVRVDLGKNKGRVTVEFASVEDLNRILDIMAPEDPGLLRQ